MAQTAEQPLTERDKVESWRLHVLIEAGYPLPLAERVAHSDADLHRGHFSHRRGTRPPERYLQGFEEIRRLQDHLAERARAEGVAVIENENVDATLGLLMQLVLDTVEEDE